MGLMHTKLEKNEKIPETNLGLIIRSQRRTKKNPEKLGSNTYKVREE